ncbi:hypothetical protein ACRQ1B_00015 [Rhizobium panacihumi]|uniref:hypothetical protein n=1 Tax=Rhizobium panacihumi TaxID=2008450 RepID=UPI003D78D406
MRETCWRIEQQIRRRSKGQVNAVLEKMDSSTAAEHRQHLARRDIIICLPDGKGRQNRVSGWESQPQTVNPGNDWRLRGLHQSDAIKEARMENASKNLADEYRRLGGTRIAVIDDNLGSSRDWDGDPPEAARYWNENIAPLSDRERRDVETFLPSVSEIDNEHSSR